MVSVEQQSNSVVARIYDDKPESYFANARDDIIAMLECGPEGAIIELGCGAGGTGRAAMKAGKAARYVGLELNGAAAEVASRSLSEVLVGDAQTLDLTAYQGQFDALVMSEVLEHLTDPWSTLPKLTACLKPGGQVFGSSPNVAYWGIVRNLILGRFRYADVGMMDRTHLRWFTPESFRELFEQSGVEISQMRPMREPGWKGRLFNILTGRRFEHLFMAQMFVIGRRRQ